MSKHPFIDKEGIIGRARVNAPISEVAVSARSSSRSLNKLKLTGKIARFQITKTGVLTIDTSYIIGDKITVSKRNAIKLGEWIMKSYGRKV